MIYSQDKPEDDVKADGTVVQHEMVSSAMSIDDELKKYPNYVGYRIRTKIKDGKDTGERALVVLVEKKVSKTELRPEEVIPKKLCGETTDVEAFGKMPRIQHFPTPVYTESIRERYRPVPGNCSIGEETISAGTAGFPAKRDGELGHFSNSHILLKTVRKDLGKQRPLKIYNPAPYDAGIPQENYCEDTVTAVIMPEGQPAFNDAGWAKGNKPNIIADYCHLMEKYTGHKLAAGVTTLEVGDKVFKIGRTTEYTESTVLDLDTVVNTNYGTDGIVLHKACIIFKDFSNGGDSGSAIYKMIDGKPYLVAYLFAGNDQYTIGHEIQNALSALRLEPLLEEGETPEPPPTPPSLKKKYRVACEGKLLDTIPFRFEAVIDLEEL